MEITVTLNGRKVIMDSDFAVKNGYAKVINKGGQDYVVPSEFLNVRPPRSPTSKEFVGQLGAGAVEGGVGIGRLLEKVGQPITPNADPVFTDEKVSKLIENNQSADRELPLAPFLRFAGSAAVQTPMLAGVSKITTPAMMSFKANPLGSALRTMQRAGNLAKDGAIGSAMQPESTVPSTLLGGLIGGGASLLMQAPGGIANVVNKFASANSQVRDKLISSLSDQELQQILNYQHGDRQLPASGYLDIPPLYELEAKSAGSPSAVAKRQQLIDQVKNKFASITGVPQAAYPEMTANAANLNQANQAATDFMKSQAREQFNTPIDTKTLGAEIEQNISPFSKVAQQAELSAKGTLGLQATPEETRAAQLASSGQRYEGVNAQLDGAKDALRRAYGTDNGDTIEAFLSTPVSIANPATQRAWMDTRRHLASRAEDGITFDDVYQTLLQDPDAPVQRLFQEGKTQEAIALKQQLHEYLNYHTDGEFAKYNLDAGQLARESESLSAFNTILRKLGVKDTNLKAKDIETLIFRANERGKVKNDIPQPVLSDTELNVLREAQQQLQQAETARGVSSNYTNDKNLNAVLQFLQSQKGLSALPLREIPPKLEAEIPSELGAATGGKYNAYLDDLQNMQRQADNAKALREAQLKYSTARDLSFNEFEPTYRSLTDLQLRRPQQMRLDDINSQLEQMDRYKAYTGSNHYFDPSNEYLRLQAPGTLLGNLGMRIIPSSRTLDFSNRATEYIYDPDVMIKELKKAYEKATKLSPIKNAVLSEIIGGSTK